MHGISLVAQWAQWAQWARNVLFIWQRPCSYSPSEVDLNQGHVKNSLEKKLNGDQNEFLRSSGEASRGNWLINTLPRGNYLKALSLPILLVLTHEDRKNHV